jgi:hypothetical protein
LARRLFLNRPVVVKVLARDRASDPIFKAHYVREAFAAAQLEHPHLVALRELGVQRGRLYAAVEWTSGLSLAQMLQDQHRIEPGLAAVLMVQAARGLKAAHDQGLIHRDVKPENLRLDHEGLLKVDDLGLEMTPSLAAAMERKEKGGLSDPLDAGAPASVRRATNPSPPPLPAAVGTPAFMAPEQARDPLEIDGRADIYALGCTFYNLVTGRPPFSGDHAVELIRKHQEESVVPPAELVPGLPRQVSDIIRTMMGKSPEERYPNMAVVVDVLEGFLGIRQASSAIELTAAGRSIRQAADALAASPARRLRFQVFALSAAIWLSFVLFLAVLGLSRVMLVIAGLGAVTGAVLIISSAITHKSELLPLVREAILGGSPSSWAIGGLVILGVIVCLWIWGGCLPWFLLVCVGCLSGAFHVFVDRPLAAERGKILQETRQLLRRLRARGQDEATLQELFVREGGRHGEQLLEAIFGYRIAIAARVRWGAGGPAGRRPRAFSWRDSLFWVLERRLQERRDRQHLRVLQDAEEGRLEAQGINLLTARRKARRIAKAVVLTAAEWRDEQRLSVTSDDATTPRSPSLLERLKRAADQPESVLEPYETQPSAFRRWIDSLAGMFLGRRLRFLLGAALLVLFAAWLDAEGIITAQQVRDQTAQIAQITRKAIDASDPAVLREVQWNIPLDSRRLEEPVDWDWLPTDLRGGLHGSDLAVGTLILLISTFSRRKLVGAMALIGTALVLLWPRANLTVPWVSSNLDAHAQARALGILALLVGLSFPWRRHAS